jgi:hypothetical protein
MAIADAIYERHLERMRACDEEPVVAEAGGRRR